MLNFLGTGRIEAKDVEKAIKELPLKEKVKAIAIYSRYKQILLIEEEQEKAIRAVEKQFIKKDEPIMAAISSLANGRPLRPDEVREPENYLSKEEIQTVPEHLVSAKLPCYWAKCLKGSNILKGIMGLEDDALLNAIEDVRVEDEEDTDNFTTVFDMAPNAFIANKQLRKRFVLGPDSQPLKTQSTPIEWTGKNITLKEVKKKQKNKKTGQHRMVTRTVETKSFFNLFRTLEKKEDDEENQKLEDDFEIIGIIVDEIIPYSLEYYLGIEHEGDQLCENDDGDEEEDDGTDDDGKKRKSKSKSKSKSKEKALPKQECKTQ